MHIYPYFVKKSLVCFFLSDWPLRPFLALFAVLIPQRERTTQALFFLKFNFDNYKKEKKKTCRESFISKCTKVCAQQLISSHTLKPSWLQNMNTVTRTELPLGKLWRLEDLLCIEAQG